MGPEAVIINGIIIASACSGCKYYSACGSADRVEPCKGWERAYSVNPLDDMDWESDDE